MRKILGIVALLMCALSVKAQVVISGQAINQFGQPLPGAKVRVCAVTSTGTPCIPVASIYLDFGLTIPVSNPYTSDQYGNYTVYAPIINTSPSFYEVQLIPTSGVTWTYIVSAGLGGSTTNLSGGVTGSIPYQSQPNTTAMLAPNTTATPMYLIETGTGSVGQAPMYSNFFTATNPIYSTPGIQPKAGNSLVHYYWRDQLTQPASSGNGLETIMLNSAVYAYDGGFNFNENGYTNKTFYSNLDLDRYAYTPGEHNGMQIINNCYSVGDCIGGAFGVFDFGGISNGTDEGAHIITMGGGQGYIEYRGTCATGCTTGSTNITVSPTQGQNTQGARRFMLDLDNTYTSGTITTITNNISTGPVVMTGSGTGWAVDTFTTTTSAIIVPGGKTSPGSTTVSVGSTSGMTNGELVCVSDAGSFEMVTVSTVNTITSFTAIFGKSHNIGATITYGGLCGRYFSFPVDTWNTSGGFGFTTVTAPLIQAWPVVGSTSATSLQVWISAAGNYDGYLGQAKSSAGSNSYTLYYGSEVVSVAAGLSGVNLGNSFTVAPNIVPLSVGTNLSNTLYPEFKLDLGNNQLSKFFFTPANDGGGFGINYNGLWTNSDTGFFVNNATGRCLYGGICGNTGNIGPPKAAFRAAGWWQQGLQMDFAPPSGALQIGCAINSSTGNSDCTTGTNTVLLAPTANGGGDVFKYNPTAFDWTLTSSKQVNSFIFDHTGTFTSANLNITGTVSHSLSLGQGFTVTGGPVNVSTTGTSSFSGGPVNISGTQLETANTTPAIFLGTTTMGGNGTSINQWLKVTGTLTYTSITNGQCQEQSLTNANINAGSGCIANVVGSTGLGVGFMFGGCRIASTTANISVCNIGSSPGIPNAVTWVAWLVN